MPWGITNMPQTVSHHAKDTPSAAFILSFTTSHALDSAKELRGIWWFLSCPINLECEHPQRARCRLSIFDLFLHTHMRALALVCVYTDLSAGDRCGWGGAISRNHADNLFVASLSLSLSLSLPLSYWCISFYLSPPHPLAHPFFRRTRKYRFAIKWILADSRKELTAPRATPKGSAAEISCSVVDFFFRQRFRGKKERERERDGDDNLRRGRDEIVRGGGFFQIFAPPNNRWLFKRDSSPCVVFIYVRERGRIFKSNSGNRAPRAGIIREVNLPDSVFIRSCEFGAYARFPAHVCFGTRVTYFDWRSSVSPSELKYKYIYIFLFVVVQSPVCLINVMNLFRGGEWWL